MTMADLLGRRTFLQLSATAALTAPSTLRAADKAAEKLTFTYKTVGDCPIQADVYGASAGEARPVVVWIHGGALIMGSRTGIDPAFRDALVRAGYVVVSIDYRLAPETKLPAILDDVRDACAWVRAEDPKKLGIRPEKLAVMGGSAGGYLTLTTGYRVDPSPLALVSFWGYGDITGPWYSKPDPFYRTQPLVSEDDARKAVGTRVLAESAGKNDRGKFYLYCRQNGLWPKEVTGLDPETDPKAFDPFCPIRHVTDKYPPTLLIHGTKDTDVPYALSEEMDATLEQHGVENELITIPDAGHGPARAARPDRANLRAASFSFSTLT